MPADPDVPVRIYRPHGAQGAIVWLHGGGFVMGDLDTEHPWAARLADGAGAVVISVGYRLAPEHRFPAAMDDAYAVLTWTAEHAAELGIDPDRIAVGGHSAGGGLAAAVALRARDQQGPRIRFQLLNQPVPRRPAGDVVGAALHRHAVDDPRQGRRNLAALPGLARPPRRTPPRRGPLTCPACRPPISPPRSSTLSATRTSATRCACCRRACRLSCTSGRARSTGRRRSCPPRCPSGRSPRPAPSCAVPWLVRCLRPIGPPPPRHTPPDERAPHEGRLGMRDPTPPGETGCGGRSRSGGA